MHGMRLGRSGRVGHRVHRALSHDFDRASITTCKRRLISPLLPPPSPRLFFLLFLRKEFLDFGRTLGDDDDDGDGGDGGRGSGSGGSGGDTFCNVG